MLLTHARIRTLFEANDMPHLFRFVEMAPHSIFYHLTQIGKSVWSRPMTLHGGNQQKVVLSWTSALAQRLELW
jgi:hypothetical protein